MADVRVKTSTATALVVVLVMLAPSSVSASTHRMTFGFARTVALDYWSLRGHTVPCNPQAHVLSDEEDAHAQASGVAFDMLADRTTCTIDVSPLSDWYRTQREYSWMYCREIAHEIGHLVGLEHDYGGVMDPYENIVPWGCDHPHKFLRHHRALLAAGAGWTRANFVRR